jgi:hypothetical protein
MWKQKECVQEVRSKREQQIRKDVMQKEGETFEEIEEL